MVLQIILADILLVARISGARKNTTQLVKYPRVLSVKPSNKVYLFNDLHEALRKIHKGQPFLQKKSELGCVPFDQSKSGFYD